MFSTSKETTIGWWLSSNSLYNLYTSASSAPTKNMIRLIVLIFRLMTKIENHIQYEWAVNRVEELLPLVNDETPQSNPNRIELELLSNLVADYSEEHFHWANLHL